MYYLYLKTHNVSGLKYLGITRRNPSTYRGSGVRWNAHLKKHGDDVSTKVLLETDCKELLAERGLELSIEWNIVESNEFANLVYESGYEGRNHGYICPESQKKHLSKLFKGKPLKPEHIEKLRYTKSKEHKKKLSDALKGKPLSEECKKNISIALKGKPKPTRSEEHKKNIAEALKTRSVNRKFEVKGVVYACRKEASAVFGDYLIRKFRQEGLAHYV